MFKWFNTLMISSISLFTRSWGLMRNCNVNSHEKWRKDNPLNGFPSEKLLLWKAACCPLTDYCARASQQNDVASAQLLCYDLHTPLIWCVLPRGHWSAKYSDTTTGALRIHIYSWIMNCVWKHRLSPDCCIIKEWNGTGLCRLADQRY